MDFNKEIKHDCEFCTKSFKSVGNLRKHQKTVKYCLDIQAQQNKEIKIIVFTCSNCDKEFSLKSNYERHTDTCNNKDKKYKQENILLKRDIQNKDEIIKKLEEKINKLEDTIAKIAEQPKTNNTTNNTTNNLNLLTPLDLKNKEYFTKTIKDHFTKDYMLEGQKGVARFAVDKLLKDADGKLKYICTDPSRHIYKFKTLEGDIEKDVKAKKLTSAILSDIFNQTRDMTSEGIKGAETEVFILYTDNFQEIRDMKEDNGDFRTELSILTTM